jgi:hypothetical protein
MSLGNENNPLKARMQGVRTARDATNVQPGQSQKVTHVVEGRVVFVNYNDEQGRSTVAMFFDVGGQYYAPGDTVAWCSTLKPMTDWLAKGVADFTRNSEPAVIPKEDSVDVLDESTP